MAFIRLLKAPDPKVKRQKMINVIRQHLTSLQCRSRKSKMQTECVLLSALPDMGDQTVRRPKFLRRYLASRSQSEGSSLSHGLDSSGVVTNGSYSMYCSV